MCGILGSVDLAFSEEALGLIAHRGPDDSGMFSSDINGRKVQLGHRRLSIVELSSAGHQPMTSKCGNFTIVFNGEIYNHVDLRRSLPEISFVGGSDTETILYYIAKFGIESVRDFNGIFAFAFLDKAAEKLFVVRDRYGVKPLYYSTNGNRFIFCSEIRPIQSLVRSNISQLGLATLLRLRYCPSPFTLLESVFKIRPGHIGIFDLKRSNLSWLPFVRPVPINGSISFSEAQRRYEELLEAAVRRQLMADVEVGLLLSGGLDSALIGLLAQRYYEGKLKSFSVGFGDGSNADELFAARKSARLLKTNHHELVLSASQYESGLPQVVNCIEEPLGTTSIIPLYFLCELVSKHVKVVLSGQGADEPLGGYVRYQGELYRRFLPVPLITSLAGVLANRRLKNEAIDRAVYALSEPDTVARFDKTYALFRYDEIRRLTGLSECGATETISYYFKLLNGATRSPVEAMMSNDLRMNLSDDLLLCADKVSMHFSVESRVPMLDNDLVDFVESLPAAMRLGIRRGKIIHKKVAERMLPSEIVHQTKKGFMTPANKWFKSELGGKYRELLTSDRSSFSRYFNALEIRRIFDEHSRGMNREKQIFTLISIYYWMESHFNQ